MQSSPTIQQRFSRWLAGNPDEQILRWIFRAVVAVTLFALATDLAATTGLFNTVEVLAPAGSKTTAPPPSIDGSPASPSILTRILTPDRRLTPMPRLDSAMAKPMTFELVSGGKLMATGSITPGISEAFAQEIGKRSDYIKTVVLNSPGGSVSDALAMGTLIRKKNLDTEVEAGKYCASSCPLIFAGGVERRAGEKAIIGVHQIFSGELPASAPERDGMSDAQRISALCQRHLGDMGVSLQVWVHAMETPKEKLFVFKPEELNSLKLITSAQTMRHPESLRIR